MKTRKKITKKRTVNLMDFSNLNITPYNHQIEAAHFLLKKKRAILADEMGAGKTLSSLLALNSLNGKRLIVCPASLKLNWKKEIESISNNKITIINGKKWIAPKRNEWTIINYDILKNHTDKIKKANFKGVIFDEAHFCKSINNNGYGGSKRARSFIQIANKIEHVFLLTGTPITNKTKDIYNLLKAIKHPLSKNFKTFAKQYCNPVFNGYGWSYDGSSHQAELNEELKSFMLRRLKEDLLDLPNKTRSFIPVDIPLTDYKQKVDEYMNQRSNMTKRNEHLVYLNAMRHILAKEKTKHTAKLIQAQLDTNQPTVLFTSYQYVVDQIISQFPSAVTITGKDSKKKRDEAVQSFQKRKTDLIICNLIAGGVGITLTRAHVLFTQDLDWNPANHLQAEDRIHRIGQTNPVHVNYIYSEGTIDEKMASLLESKLVNINQIIDDKDEGFLDEVICWLSKKK